jgi:hypothetical protein
MRICGEGQHLWTAAGGIFLSDIVAVCGGILRAELP